MKHILAIDLGTSGPKVALVTTQGEVVAYEFEATPTLLLPKGGAEQRPADWWQAIGDFGSLRQRLIGYHRGTVLFCPNWVPRPRKVGQR